MKFPFAISPIFVLPYVSIVISFGKMMSFLADNRHGNWKWIVIEITKLSGTCPLLWCKLCRFFVTLIYFDVNQVKRSWMFTVNGLFQKKLYMGELSSQGQALVDPQAPNIAPGYFKFSSHDPPISSTKDVHAFSGKAHFIFRLGL